MENPFLDKENKPTQEIVAGVLGNSFPLYQQIIEMVVSFKREWTFTKSSGWMLKFHDQKKALFYLIPLSDAFKIGLTLRESERESFLQNAELGQLHETIQAAKKYHEGYALHWDITNQADFQSFDLLMTALIKIRA